MFEVMTDHRRMRLVATIADPVANEEGRDCALEVQAAVRKAGWVSGQYSILLDATAYITQPQRIATSILEVAIHGEFKAGRIACVSQRPLAKLQLRRILPERDVRFFDTSEEAIAWLDLEDRPVDGIEPS